MDLLWDDADLEFEGRCYRPAASAKAVARAVTRIKTSRSRGSTEAGVVAAAAPEAAVTAAPKKRPPSLFSSEPSSKRPVPAAKREPAGRRRQGDVISAAASAATARKVLSLDTPEFPMVPRSLSSMETRLRHKLRTGSHCSGWLTEAQALEHLGVPHTIVMACDCNPKVKLLIQQSFDVEHFFDDMLQTPVELMPGNLDLYSCGFPCQPYSSAGLNKALSDDRALPLETTLAYISKKKPRAFILENVSNLASKHRTVLNSIIADLEQQPDYTVHWTILNTNEHGIPQCRRRVYIIGVQKHVLLRPFSWPARLPPKPLSRFWDRSQRNLIAKHDHLPDDVLRETAMRNLEHAFRSLRAQGHVPNQTECIVDLQAGKGRELCVIDEFPTILAGRAESQAYYATKLQRRVTIRELMRLQGVELARFKLDGVSATAVGRMAGNAMSCNVVEEILKQLLACAGLSR